MREQAEKLDRILKSQYYSDFRQYLNGIRSQYADRRAFVLKKKGPGKEVSYTDMTYSMFCSDVEAFGSGLAARGLAQKRIAITGSNCYHWVVAYLAILCGGGVAVPLDKNLPYDELLMSLKRSGADVVICDSERAPLVDQASEELEKKPVRILMNTEKGEGLMTSVIEEGRAVRASGDRDYDTLPIDTTGPAVILFTSGTTANAKAVLLSQKNILVNLYDMGTCEEILPDDVNMAFLPYHHSFGSTGQLVMLNAGAATAFCDGLKYIQRNLVEYKISVFVCVPLLIEALYKKILQGVEKSGKGDTFRKGLKISDFLLKFHIDVRRKLFKDVHAQLGGALRLMISGASALDPETAKGLRRIGIESLQGYGMTESAPVLAAENRENRKAGSVGKSMPSVEIRVTDVGEDGIGELIAKGGNVMLGYMDDPEETAKVLRDGWLHTGDLCRIDDDGYIFLCGRRKNVIVLKNGKNVYPEELEALFEALPYTAEVMVFGLPRARGGDDNDLALWVKVVYDPSAMTGEDGQPLSKEQIEETVRADMDRINDGLPQYKHIKNLIVTDEPMIKTTTQKVKRRDEIARIMEQRAAGEL